MTWSHHHKIKLIFFTYLCIVPEGKSFLFFIFSRTCNRNKKIMMEEKSTMKDCDGNRSTWEEEEKKEQDKMVGQGEG